MNLLVNGEQHEHVGNGSIASLLEEIGANAGRIAVMQNGAVVSRSNWDSPVLQENDRLELLVFAAGG